MGKFFRWYYQNKNKFWVIVLLIIGGYAIILFLNNISKTNNTLSYTNTENVINSNYVSNYSIIDNEYIDNKELQDSIEIIDRFISFCNDGKIQEAYQMISNNCKKTMFPTLEDFRKNYYNRVFKTTKIYEVQNWSTKTYLIKFRENPMETREIK